MFARAQTLECLVNTTHSLSSLSVQVVLKKNDTYTIFEAIVQLTLKNKIGSYWRLFTVIAEFKSSHYYNFEKADGVYSTRLLQ